MNGWIVGAALVGAIAFMRKSGPSGDTDPSDDGVPPSPRLGATPDRLVKLSDHYVLADVLVSAHFPELAAKLKPTDTQVENLKALMSGPVEGIVEKLDATPTVTSGFRDGDLNAAISNSSSTSQHMAKGDSAAVDLVAPDLMDQLQMADALVASGKKFDQAIIYSKKRGGQLHVSHRRTGKNRHQLMVAPDEGGYVTVKDVNAAIELLGDSVV